MAEDYNKNGERAIKPDYKKTEEMGDEPHMVGNVAEEMRDYKAIEISDSPENIKEPEIKREGQKRCWCGSGKKFEDCHGKHLRADKNPKAITKEYEIELNVRDIDEYEKPDSEKEYEENDEGEGKEDDFLGVEETGEEREKESANEEYKEKEEL